MTYIDQLTASYDVHGRPHPAPRTGGRSNFLSQYDGRVVIYNRSLQGWQCEMMAAIVVQLLAIYNNKNRQVPKIAKDIFSPKLRKSTQS